VLAARARQAFEVGEAGRAATLLARAAELKPDCLEYVSNLGMVLAKLGQLDEAIAAFQRALALKPDSPEALNNLGAALRDRKNHEASIALFRQAIFLRPNYPEALYNLGVSLQELEKLDEAIDAFSRAAALRPDFAKVYNNLGLVFFKQGKIAEAASAYERAVQLDEHFADAWHGLGCVHQQIGKQQEAIQSYHRALSLKPDLGDAHYNLGRIAQEEKRTDEAIAHYRAAWSFQPKLIEAANNLSILLCRQDKWEEAHELLLQALQINPVSANTYNNLGNALQDLGRYDEAMQAYEKALALEPDYLQAKWNRGVLLLSRGHLEEGWRGYETRLRITGMVADPGYSQPKWDGSDLNGRTILLHAEQGYGDTMQFIRYAPMVRARGGRVILRCPGGLRRLFQGQLGIEQVVGHQDPLPAFDLYCPLLSLPAVFQTTLENIPAQFPYLKADPVLVCQWRERLSLEPARLKIGIAWAGNPAHEKDQYRSMPQAALAPLAKFGSDVRFVSLQKNLPRTVPCSRHAPRAVADDTRSVPATDTGEGKESAGLDLLDWTGELNDFADTAALVSCLDLVIAVDTAVVHLAGALGKPVWVLLAIPTDWRWMFDRGDSPWYPAARLFRQPRRGHWETPIGQIVDALGDLV
jgi:tetratricopeptide (TPR) repeat protein